MKVKSVLWLMLLSLVLGAPAASSGQVTRGEPGPRGLPGKPGLTNRGAWSASIIYDSGDLVTFSNVLYVAKDLHSNSQPPSAHWTLLIQGGLGPAGAAGADGAPGANGANGSNGATWRFGTGAPSNGTGVDGDLYLRTTTGDVYGRTGGSYVLTGSLAGPTGATGPAGAAGAAGAAGSTGATGAAGSNGATWRTGSGAPSNGTGANGDLYLNTANGDVYQRSSGAYAIITNLIGPAGSGSGTGYGIATKTATAAPYSADNTGVATAQEVPIQAAIDAIATGETTGAANTQGGIVFLPSGTYQTNNPIWLEDKITVKGEGALQTKIVCRTGQPAFILGQARRTSWNRSARSDEATSGTVTFTNGSAAVVGVGTHFTTEFTPYLTYPVLIRNSASSTYYTVSSVANDTHLTLTATFAQPTAGTVSANRGVDYLTTIPATFAADHRVDSFGKLDTSLATATGQRYGITSKSATSGSPFADHWLVFPYGGPSIGVGNPADHWENTNKLTLDIAIEGPAGGAITYDICGMGSGYRVPAPWWFTATGGSSYGFTFFTREGLRDSGNTYRSFNFGSPGTASGVQKITIQIDFSHNSDGTTDNSATCDIKAWINGSPQSITRAYGTRLTSGTGSEPSFTAADNWHFAKSEPHFPFTMFNGASNCQVFTNAPSARPNGTVYGFRIDNAPRYTTTTGAQARIDAGSLNDSYRYGTSGATSSLIFAMDTATAPTADAAGRWVKMVGNASPGSTHYGLFIPDLSERAIGYAIDETVSDLEIQGNQGTANILFGPILNPTVERVTVTSNVDQACIGGMVQSTYYVKIRDCFLGGSQWAWIAGQGWAGEISNLSSNGVQQDCAIRLDSSDVVIRNITTGNVSGNAKAIIMITGQEDYSSRYRIDHISCDNEGFPFPLVALIYCERHSTAQTYLYCNDIRPSYVPDQIPMIRLADNGIPTYNGRGAYGPGVFTLTNSEVPRIGVETDGPGWHGVVEGLVYDDITGFANWHNHVGADGVTNLVAKLRLASLPTGGSHQKNGVTVEIMQPGDAANFRYVCSQSGYGTWNTGTSYVAGTIVYKSGTLYRCLTANSADSPPSGNWVALAAWSGATAYAVGDLVTRSSLVWQCAVANTGVTPSTTAQPGLYYAGTWRQVGVVAQALWAPTATLATPVAGP